jgi:thymidine phosphorylase
MFIAKKINIDSKNKPFVLMIDKDAKELGLKTLEKVKIKKKNSKKSIICDLEIINHNGSKIVKKGLIKSGEIGIYEKAFEELELIENEKIDIIPIEKPKSLNYVRDKFIGKIKITKEIAKEIVKDIVENRYGDVETTYFVLACSVNKLTDEEVINLTEAMINVGKILKFKSDIIVDKHCIGGIPNNRTTMIVVPIIAAFGLTIPKTSSRSITSPAGTADTMEVLANVNIPLKEMYEIVKKENGCIIWGGGIELSPADDIIINVEHPLDIDSEGQMIASILSKKKSAGSTHVLIDIPIGEDAKVSSLYEGYRLMKRFEKIGKAIGLNVKCILTDGFEPIGNGIGPLFEAKDVISVLENKENAPEDLKEKALTLAGQILEMSKRVKKDEGYKIAKEILESGKALEKFNSIINAQGRKEIPKEGKYSFEIKSDFDGKIKKINNKKIAKMAFLLGAPEDKGAGLYLMKKTDDVVKKGETLFKIYSNSELKLKYTLNYYKENKNTYIIE